MSQYTLSQRNQLAKQLVALEQEWKSIKASQIYGTVQGSLFKANSDKDVVFTWLDSEIHGSSGDRDITFTATFNEPVSFFRMMLNIELITVTTSFLGSHDLAPWRPNDDFTEFIMPVSLSLGGSQWTTDWPDEVKFHAWADVESDRMPVSVIYEVTST